MLMQYNLMPAMYEDSTHQLWRCETSNGEFVLKVCHHDRVKGSPTWEVMHSLFDFSLLEELAHSKPVRAMINHHGLLHIPEISDAGSDTEDTPAYVLSHFAEGETLSTEKLTESMVIDFARHIGGLHHHSQPDWGRLLDPQHAAKVWPEQLIKTFLRFSSKLKIGEPWLYKVMSEIDQLTPSVFCPIMLDNRWDQYLVNDGRLTSLVDLDAFVMGPPELELVLLEYQLTQPQADVFARIYKQYQPMPDLSRCRRSYRLLLFLMNALGETDLDQWMRAPARW